MSKNRSEENKTKYNIKNRAKKVVANSMRKEAEKELTKNKSHFYTGEVHEKKMEKILK